MFLFLFNLQKTADLLKSDFEFVGNKKMKYDVWFDIWNQNCPHDVFYTWFLISREMQWPLSKTWLTSYLEETYLFISLHECLISVTGVIEEKSKEVRRAYWLQFLSWFKLARFAICKTKQMMF